MMFVRLVNAVSLIFLSFFITNVANAGTVKGVVYNITTGVPLTGAKIHLEPTDKYSVSGLDGSFTINNIPKGTYTITINHASFKSFSKLIEIKKNELIRINVEMVSVKEMQLEEIIVKGKEMPGKEPLALERFSSQIVNIVSSESIQFSPDLTVANLIQRIPGVTIERDDIGEGEFAILRGMDKRYN